MSSTREVTVVEVRNPVNQTKSGKIAFTDYEICIKTTSMAFMIPQSAVRRRYSDFVWLRSWLSKNNESFNRKKMPKLPPKKLVRRFDDEFLYERQKGLQKFLRKIIEKNVFLSDKALHLFLQSGMPVQEIQLHLDGKIEKNVPAENPIVFHHDYSFEDTEQNNDFHERNAAECDLTRENSLRHTFSENYSIGEESSSPSDRSFSLSCSSFEKIEPEDCS